MDFEHLRKSYDIRDQLDDIASADPPAYLQRCFAEGLSASTLPWPRAQQLGICGMVLDAVADGREYEFLEHELIADWRVHYAAGCPKIKSLAARALRRVLERDRPHDSAAAAEIETLANRLAEA